MRLKSDSLEEVSSSIHETMEDLIMEMGGWTLKSRNQRPAYTPNAIRGKKTTVKLLRELLRDLDTGVGTTNYHSISCIQRLKSRGVVLDETNRARIKETAEEKLCELKREIKEKMDEMMAE